MRPKSLRCGQAPDGSVRVRAVAPLDLAYLRGLDETLAEWNSPVDEEAFRDL